MKRSIEETVQTFRLHKCGGGAQWSSPVASAINLDATGEPCTFSGCKCGTLVETIRDNATLEEAAAWFRRP